MNYNIQEIQQKLNNVENIKMNIKASLENYGKTVTNDFNTYSGMITNLTDDATAISDVIFGANNSAYINGHKVYGTMTSNFYLDDSNPNLANIRREVVSQIGTNIKFKGNYLNLNTDSSVFPDVSNMVIDCENVTKLNLQGASRKYLDLTLKNCQNIINYINLYNSQFYGTITLENLNSAAEYDLNLSRAKCTSLTGLENLKFNKFCASKTNITLNTTNMRFIGNNYYDMFSDVGLAHSIEATAFENIPANTCMCQAFNGLADYRLHYQFGSPTIVNIGKLNFQKISNANRMFSNAKIYQGAYTQNSPNLIIDNATLTVTNMFTQASCVNLDMKVNNSTLLEPCAMFAFSNMCSLTINNTTLAGNISKLFFAYNSQTASAMYNITLSNITDVNGIEFNHLRSLNFAAPINIPNTLSLANFLTETFIPQSEIVFDMGEPTNNIQSIFSNAKGFSNVSNLNASLAPKANYAFWNSTAEYIKGCDFSNIIEATGMFGNCKRLVKVEGLNLEKLFNTSSMFSGAQVPVTDFILNSANNSIRMFSEANFTNKNINMSIPLITNTYQMFHYSNITNISILDMSNVISTSNMFSYCNNLAEVNLPISSKLESMTKMFAYCNNLSNASINNIINYCLASNVVASERNLQITNFSSPLYGTKFNNSYYSDRLSELTAAGWNY